MLAYAKRRIRHLSAQLSRGQLEQFNVRGFFDLAHCLVGTFKYLLTERDARQHLESVVRALRPGGIYVLGLHLTDYEITSRTRERWVGERRGTRVVCNIQVWPSDRRKRLERVRCRLHIQEKQIQKRIESHWMFRTYDARQLRRILRFVPVLEHVATCDFWYDITSARELDDCVSDCVLILRRK